MKGKGKGDRTGGKGSERAKEKEDMAEIPLQFPDVAMVDHSKMCVRYTAILSREDSETVGIEEIDSLQTDLETLLASVAKRMRVLENEIQVLNNHSSGQDAKIVSTKDSVVSSKDKGKGGGKGIGEHAKRSGKGEDKPSKKLKDNSGKGSFVKGGIKGKVQQVKLQEYEFPESPSAKPPPPVEPPKLKTDVPNRFWALVEPYCADITNDNLKVLEEIMKSYEDDGDYYKIPPLGKHYAEKWAQEDLLEEQREGGKLGERRRTSSELTNLMKKDDESSPFGPLTQRLVQALIEENIMTPLDDSNSISEAEAAEAASISPRSLAKQLNIGNTAALERRIKRELEENGILEHEDVVDEHPDDEIVVELRKKQQELKVMSQHNLMMTKRIYKQAKDEIAWQDLRKKVAAADNEVMEAYRKIQATKAKKKTPSKKEIESAKKALRDRENLVCQLESMGK